MSEWLHQIAHWFGWNGGRVETWWEPNCMEPGAKLMVGFRCDGCNRLSGVHQSRVRWPK